MRMIESQMKVGVKKIVFSDELSFKDVVWEVGTLEWSHLRFPY
jgi:hypothetical protein